MLSTLVLMPMPTANPPVAVASLVRTLSSLVPGTIGGVIRDVAIVTGRRDPEVERVAEHAGCALIAHDSFAGAMRAAIAGARSSTLLLLRAGALVDRAFVEEVAMCLESAGPAPALLLREAPDGLVRRMLPMLAPAAGLIAPSSAVDAAAPDFETLVRRMGRTRTLTARAAMAH